MKVTIAGYNIDHSQIKKLTDQNKATPETISAAYARISRSKKSVGALRQESVSDVAKARKSNNSIVFEMGHASVAEHAVFNFDVTGISRLLVEEVQRSRLASFTEKSQRYVTLDGDYLLPKEIAGTALAKEFHELVALQNQLYYDLYEKSKRYLIENEFDGGKRELEGKAKEDARYVLALATQTQFGMTINARSLERLLQRLDRSALAEAQELKSELLEAARKIAPSLVRYTCCEDFEHKLYDHLPQVDKGEFAKDVKLINITSDAEYKILASLLFEATGVDFQLLLQQVLSDRQLNREEIFRQMFCDLKPWQRMPRAFEIVDLTFSMLISSSCFGQLKRHRMATILRSDYNPVYGYVVPPLLKKINGQKLIIPVMEKVEAMYIKLENVKKGLGSYILTNSHRLPVIFKTNLREVYHFSRLRSDIHAQWEIREVSAKIDRIIRENLPNAGSVIMGKDEFIAKHKCGEK